jgi:hypothetical protein
LERFYLSFNRLLLRLADLKRAKLG